MQVISSKIRYRRSSSFTMAVLFACLLGLSAALLGYALYDSNQQSFARETEAALDHEIISIQALTAGKSEADITALIAAKSAAGEPYYRYETVDGRELAGNLHALPPDIVRIKEGLLRFTLSIGGMTQALAAKIHTFENGSRLLIARDISAILESHQRLSLIATCILILMCAVVGVSFFLSYFVVSRINRIGVTARHIIATGDLSQRIAIETRWDDLSSLAQLLNALFDRMETLLNNLRDMSDHIAHDLRTPLTHLRQGLETARNQNGSTALFDPLLAEADQLLATFHALLRISAIEKQSDRQRFVPLTLHTLLQDVWELYEPVMEDKRLSGTLHMQETPLLEGDRDLLFQLFANLMDNAIKFSPVGGTLTLTLEHTGQGMDITLADQGPGIAAAERARVFDRFYRSDASRHLPGNGLGLSLVKAIAELHHARVTLSDNTPGLHIRISFPAT